MQKELILKEFDDVKKTVILLKASVKKFKPYEIDHIYTPDELESYDSLSFRFEKCIEITLNFFKGLEIFMYLKSSESLRDRLLIVQKLTLIDDIDFWMESRVLRNKVVHAYLPQKISDIYNDIVSKSNILFKYIGRMEEFILKL